MTNKTRALPWLSFFLLTIAVLVFLANYFSVSQEIHINDMQAQQIGKQIWQNESGGKLENLISWNEGEDFPSLGIGHFIWYPQGVEHTFEESFPKLLRFLSQTRNLPSELNPDSAAPWNSREEFLANRNSEFTQRLRSFLQDSFAEQTQFVIMRLQEALPRILRNTKNPFAKMHIRENFYALAAYPNGVYTLVDYVNFKGEGISEKERYNGLGWGLAQVLDHMNSSRESKTHAFVEAADFILTRRVENAPRDERRWLPGWRKRLQTYLSVEQHQSYTP
ncbi:MAG: hypothetical protein OEZ43_12485 [Gammaproteobacteria bacterium]|nr:hypothetical protein [Gammaproteobacteria bacterium]